MKKIFKLLSICLLVLVGNTLYAQVDSLRLRLDNVFLHIDKSQIPTGFLDEYGAQFVNLKRFNGLPTDSNFVDAMAWHYIYGSVYSAKIYGTNTLPTPESNYTVFNNEAILNTTINPVSLLALNYSSLKPTAMTSNLFTISNNQLYDVAGRTQSPYQLNTAFAASPFCQVDNDGVLKLIFKPTLFINNTGKTVSSLQVNFDNGGSFVTAAWNSVVSASYTTAGNKKLTFKVNFTDGTNLQCFSKINVVNASGAASRYQPSSVTIPFNPTNNNHSGGDITVQYSVRNTTPTTARKFQKTLIVVEGFDMHDAAPLLMTEGYNYESFRREISQTAVSFNGNTFNYNLDDIAGYDLVFVNYRDGTDDVLRNALMLEQVINWVNTNKATGAQQNVVMGISMGGLVSRYCLAKMTKESHNPQTRLLITHDSPHRGANIPLGMQYLINDFANKKILGRKLQDWVPLLKQAVNLQLRPATIQQLIVRNDPTTGGVQNNTFLVPGGTYRQMVTFGSTGPQPAYRFIATSQGSQCGIAVMPPSQAIVTTSGSVGFSLIFGAFGDKLIGEATVNALPNGTASQRITYFDLKIKTKIFWISFTTTLVNFEHYSPSGILGYDGCPAGTQLLSRGTGIGNIPPTWNSGPWFIPPFIFEYVYNFNGLQLQPQFSFLPTVSALDEDNITATSLYAPHQGIFYAPPPNSPTVLQTYVAQEGSSIEHTDFTARNSNWIYNEMQSISNQAVNCAGVSACGRYNTNIIGPDPVCTSPSSIYSILNLPAGATVQWQTSPAGIATPSSPNNTQTTLMINGNGVITLSAIITTACAGQPITLQKTVTVGGPLINISYAMNGQCNGGYQTWSLNASSPNAVSSWLWTVDNPSSGSWYIYNPNSPSTFVDVLNGGGISVTATNSCGSSRSGVTIWSNCPRFGIAASPNPAKDNVIISIEEPEGIATAAKTKSLIYQLKITDQLGNIKKQFTYRAGTTNTNISLRGLIGGTYTVQAFDGTSWKSIRVIKQ